VHCNQRFYFIIILLNEYKLIVALTVYLGNTKEGGQTVKFFHNFINELKMKKENSEDQNDILYWRM